MFGNNSFGNASFGASSFGATPSLGAFGSASQQPTQPAGPIGTQTSLNPTTAQETNQVRDSKTGTSSSATVTVRFQHVCAMKEYENKSIEELRLEDYAANRKFGQQQQQQTSFGFGSSPFGMNQPSSSQPSTNLFGAPSSSTSTGLFGQPNASTNTSANLFGSSFNKPATSTASPFGISSPLGTNTNTNANSSIFGQPKTGFETNNTTTNLFGSTMNKPATSTAPAFGMGSPFGFGSNQTTMNQPAASQPTTNLFGAQTSNTSTSLFGQPNASTNNNTSLFGSNSFNKPATSNASPFGIASPLGANTTTNATTSIFGQPKTGFDTNNTTTNLFGSTMNKPATSTTPAFGMGSPFGFGSNQAGMNQPTSSQPATNLFGAQTTNTSNSLFGQPSATTNTSSNLFGSTFNKPATSTASPFAMGTPLGTNANTNTTNSIFGQPKTGFETNNTASNLFGSNLNKPATSTAPAFGMGSPFGFGSNQTTMNQPAASQPTTNLFGAQTSNTSTSLFGQPNASTNNNTSLFGSNSFNKPATSNASPFGVNSPLGTNTSTNASTSIFGPPKTGFDANNTTNSLFGAALNKPTTSTTPAFGIGSSFGFGSSPVGLNQPSNSQPTTSLFGASSPNTSLFGQLNTSLGTTTSLFGPTFNKPNTSASSPFAISSPLGSSNSNPTISQYKMSAKTNVKLNKPAEIVKPRTSTVLFDGLEDGNSDDLRCAIDVFVPKKSIKKLELKPTQEDQSSSSFNDSHIRSNSPVVEDISRRYCLTNTRPEYKLKPSLEEIDKHYDSEKNTCIINYLLVERPNYGSIHFEGPLDVNNINLDEIVHIRRKEVVVYPDDENKPPVGQGLNRPATVTLYQVWPIDKSNNEIIKDINRLNLMRYPEKVESDTVKIGARFIEYRPETGSWVFAVKHFSKYGITDDDEEISNNVIPPTPQSTHQPSPPPPLRLTNGSRFSIDSTSPQSDHPTNGEGVLLNRLKKTLAPSKDNSPVSFKMSAKKNLDLSNSKTTIATNLNETKPKSVMFESFDESNYSIRHVLDEFFNEDNETESRLNDSKRSLSVHGTKRLALQNVSSNVLNISTQDHNASSLYVGVTNIPKQKRVRNIQPKPDLYPARNKLLRDISSVCISGSPRISFIIGSRRLCYAKGSQIHIGELILAQSDDLTEKLEEHLRENSIVVPFDAQPWDFLFAPYIETKDFISNASSHELLRALYGNDLESKTPYDKQDERMSRVIKWLATVNLEIQPPDDLYQLIIYHMSCDRYDLATSLAIENDHPRLALLIATQPNLKNDYIYEQLSSWRSTAADQYIDRELLKIYTLLSGCTEWKLSDGSVIYCLKGLKWTQQLCLLANHVTSFASEPDRYGFHLLPLYMKRLDTDTNDVDYHILARHSPAMILSAAKSIADEWFLLESLKSYYVINSESECINSDMIHCNLASQFVAVDLRWACFVALHIINNDVRKQVLLKCLEQNQSQLKSAESWLKQWLMIPDEFFMKASSNVQSS